MIRKNKAKLLISSLLILLPIAAGLLLWDRLPESVATHWGVDGAVDGYQPRLGAIVTGPLMILVIHWLCIFVTLRDPKNKNQTRKALGMVVWLAPATALVTSTMQYAYALDVDVDAQAFIMVGMGLMFALIGNYLPKCKHNYTLGIKVKWALESEENWNATHRLGGKLWVAGGFVMMGCALLPEKLGAVVMPLTLLVIAIVPMVYSYVYHKRQIREGTAVFTPMQGGPFVQQLYRISMVLVALLLMGVVILLFTGEIEMDYGEEAFTIEATYWPDKTVEYAGIDAIEYRAEKIPGTRTSGFGSPRLLMGTFKSDEMGFYTRYTYTNCEAGVVLMVGEKPLVISGKTPAETETMYYMLLEKCGL